MDHMANHLGVSPSRILLLFGETELSPTATPRTLKLGVADIIGEWKARKRGLEEALPWVVVLGIKGKFQSTPAAEYLNPAFGRLCGASKLLRGCRDIPAAPAPGPGEGETPDVGDLTVSCK